MTKKAMLIRSVAISDEAYESLTRVSQMTGLPLGKLATSAIQKAFDPKKNAQFAAALEAAKTNIVGAL